MNVVGSLQEMVNRLTISSGLSHGRAPGQVYRSCHRLAADAVVQPWADWDEVRDLMYGMERR